MKNHRFPENFNIKGFESGEEGGGVLALIGNTYSDL